MPTSSVLQCPIQPHPLQIQRMQQQSIQQRWMEHPMQQQTFIKPELVSQEPHANSFHTQFSQRQDTNTSLQSPLFTDTSVTSNEDTNTQMSEPFTVQPYVHILKISTVEMRWFELSNKKRNANKPEGLTNTPDIEVMNGKARTKEEIERTK
ncbi:hypothetical protein FQR65_LT09955 [Abscondita terminalis]|nr:hypothetical protein FQR65_LT09955 [Abscondita terminalis]